MCVLVHCCCFRFHCGNKCVLYTFTIVSPCNTNKSSAYYLIDTQVWEWLLFEYSIVIYIYSKANYPINYTFKRICHRLCGGTRLVVLFALLFEFGIFDLKAVSRKTVFIFSPTLTFLWSNVVCLFSSSRSVCSVNFQFEI